MNWNSSEGAGLYPITISFARKVGLLMTERFDNQMPNPSHRSDMYWPLSLRASLTLFLLAIRSQTLH
jgi:hypothetical protein